MRPNEDSKIAKTEEMNNHIRQNETSKFLMTEGQLDFEELSNEFSCKENLKDQEVSDIKQDLKEHLIAYQTR